MNSSTSVVQSATECAASASIADDPVSSPATSLSTPTRKFATNARTTESVLWPDEDSSS